MTHTKTTPMCRNLGRSYQSVYNLIRSGKLPPPQARDTSGHFLWSEEEVEAVRRTIEAMAAHRQQQPQAAPTRAGDPGPADPADPARCAGSIP